MNPMEVQSTIFPAGSLPSYAVSSCQTDPPMSAQEQKALADILAAKCDYVPHEWFLLSDAERRIFEEARPIALPDTRWYHAVMENLPEARAANGSSRTLLTAEEEKAIFLQFNYCRYRVAQLKDQAQKGSLSPSAARQLLRWQARARSYRDQIAEANLALVLAMAKRSRASGVDFGDLVSEGNMALLRAVDRFDVARGFKFSTFACRAIVKALWWMGMKFKRYRQLFASDLEVGLEQNNFQRTQREEHYAGNVDELRRVLRENRAALSQLEMEVLEHRFALGAKSDNFPDARPLTLEQVGRLIGVAKGRVRKIQHKALQKLAQSLGSDFWG